MNENRWQLIEAWEGEGWKWKSFLHKNQVQQQGKALLVECFEDEDHPQQLPGVFDVDDHDQWSKWDMIKNDNRQLMKGHVGEGGRAGAGREEVAPHLQESPLMVHRWAVKGQKIVQGVAGYPLEDHLAQWYENYLQWEAQEK